MTIVGKAILSATVGGRHKVFQVIAIPAVLVLFFAAVPVGRALEVEACAVSYQDIDGDGRPDLATLRCPFAGGDGDTALVYDQAGNMTSTSEKGASVDWADDIWVFDAGGDGVANLIIDFQQENGAVVAYLYDDQDGDRRVAYHLEGSEVVIDESPQWTVQVRAMDGWWEREGLVNYNLDIQVDGKVFAASGAEGYLDRLENDAHIDYSIYVRDPDHDGKPDYQIVQATPPVPDSWDIYRTMVIVNTHDDELAIADSVLWPYLGSVVGPAGQVDAIVKPRNQGFPPVRISWARADVSYVGEFVASRWNDHNWSVSSVNRLGDGALVEANFEAPFAGYDLANDQDRRPELQIHVEHFGESDVVYLTQGTRPPLGFPFQNVRYSWDQNNDGLWDFKIDTVGRYRPTDEIVLPELEFRGFDYADLPGWVVDREWDGVTFAVAEAPYPESSEGIYGWSAASILEHYLLPEADILSESYSSIAPGLRGEYRLASADKPSLYLSPVDHKLHLMHALGGVWNVNGSAEVRYANLNDDAYVDQWTFLESGEPVQELNLGGDYLVCASRDQVWFKRHQLDSSPLELLPPTNHSEWLDLRTLLPPPDASFAFSDCTSLLDEHEGSGWSVKGALLRQFQPEGSGFRFVLEMLPGFGIEGDVEPEIAHLLPGAYVVEYRDGFVVEPLRPAQPALLEDTIRLSSSVPVIHDPLQINAMIQNSGDEDVPDLKVLAYARHPKSLPQMIAETSLVLPARQSVPVTLDWTPPLAGEWELVLSWGMEGREPADSASAVTSIRVDVEPAPRLTTREILRLSNVEVPGVWYTLVGSLGLAAAALMLISVRAAGGKG